MAVTLTWEGDFRFRGTGEGGVPVIVDSDAIAGLSPTESLLAAIAGCMAVDVVDILRKGRQQVTAMVIRASGTRRERPPRRYLSIALAFEIEGRGLDPAKARRAVELSRSTYCSVWNSMAPDIALDVTLELKEASGGAAAGGSDR